MKASSLLALPLTLLLSLSLIVPVAGSITGVLVSPISGAMFPELTSPLGTVVTPAAGLMKLVCQRGTALLPALSSASSA